MTSTPRRRASAAPARSLAALATLLAAAGTVSACNGGQDIAPAQSAPAGTSASPAATAPLKVRSGVTRVVGGALAPEARNHLATRFEALVEGYFRAAFLTPHAGRRDTPASFPGFTPAARVLAEHDRGVLTGASYAGADQTSPEGGTAYASVLAPNGHAVGATVRVSLTLRVTSHGRTRPVAVAGRLLLTPTPGGWRIFGYDLSQSGRRARTTS